MSTEETVQKTPNQIPGLSYDERSEEEQVYYLKLAGKICYEVFQEIAPTIKPGAKVLDIISATEKLIFEKGARPSFPVNISINNVAAHYTSPANDETIIPEGSIVKFDMGTHIDGFISDKAESFCFNDELKLLKDASYEAWKAGMELVRAGLETSMIGVAVEEKIREFNYLPIRELAGHRLERYKLHGTKSLPNIKLPFAKANSTLEAKESYALETFATTGSGSVHDVKSKTYIYMLLPQKVPVRAREAKVIRNYAFREFSTMPFAERWLMVNPDFNPGRVRLTLNEMIRNNGLYEYSTLVENDKNAFISQYENSFIVTDDKYELTTLPPFDIKKPDSVKEREEKAEEQKEKKPKK